MRGDGLRFRPGVKNARTGGPGADTVALVDKLLRLTTPYTERPARRNVKRNALITESAESSSLHYLVRLRCRSRYTAAALPQTV